MVRRGHRGLTYDFMLAPGSEAPSKCSGISKKKLIESAEDVTHTLHNTYSLRGAIREPLPWSKYIRTTVRWGDKAEIIMAQHHWPTWGNENVVKLLKASVTSIVTSTTRHFGWPTRG